MVILRSDAGAFTVAIDELLNRRERRQHLASRGKIRAHAGFRIAPQAAILCGHFASI